MPFDEDLTVFLDEDVFASEMTVGVNTVSVIFEAEHVLVDVGTEAAVSDIAPAALCRVVDVPAVAQGDAVSIGGVSYEVVDIQPDGTGITLLILHKTS